MNFYPERFIAAAFLTVGYLAPEPADIENLLKLTKALLGYEVVGYQVFLSEEGTDKIIESHVRGARSASRVWYANAAQFDAFYAIIFPHNPDIWKTDMSPLGALKKTLLEDKFTQYASYLTEEVGLCTPFPHTSADDTSPFRTK